MVARISVKDDIAKVLGTLAKQFPQAAEHAAQRAVTKVAWKVKEAEEREIARVFSNPTNYTLKSVKIRYRRREIEATVWLKDEGDAGKGTPATKFLAPQISGGDRSAKRFERALQRIGVMPAGWLAMPGEGADIDAHGNMSRGQIVQILAFFRAFGEQGYKANMNDKGRARMRKGTKSKRGMDYFAVYPGARNSHLLPGIYKRTYFGFTGPRGGQASAIKPILIFVPSARYQPRFDFFGIAQRTVEQHFEPEMRAALAKEMSKIG